jgi:signal transduction histidine kinase
LRSYRPDGGRIEVDIQDADTHWAVAIAKRIVDLHDGRVWVEDNPEGKGSVFFVSLPK